jgi:hypothetical protein
MRTVHQILKKILTTLDTRVYIHVQQSNMATIADCRTEQEREISIFDPQYVSLSTFDTQFARL